MLRVWGRARLSSVNSMTIYQIDDIHFGERTSLTLDSLIHQLGRVVIKLSMIKYFSKCTIPWHSNCSA